MWNKLQVRLTENLPKKPQVKVSRNKFLCHRSEHHLRDGHPLILTIFLTNIFQQDINMFSNRISKLQYIKLVKFVNKSVSKSAVRLFHIFSCQNSCGIVKRKWTKSCRNYLQCGRCGIASFVGESLLTRLRAK